MELRQVRWIRSVLVGGAVCGLSLLAPSLASPAIPVDAAGALYTITGKITYGNQPATDGNIYLITDMSYFAGKNCGVAPVQAGGTYTMQVTNIPECDGLGSHIDFNFIYAGESAGSDPFPTDSRHPPGSSVKQLTAPSIPGFTPDELMQAHPASGNLPYLAAIRFSGKLQETGQTVPDTGTGVSVGTASHPTGYFCGGPPEGGPTDGAGNFYADVPAPPGPSECVTQGTTAPNFVLVANPPATGATTTYADEAIPLDPEHVHADHPWTWGAVWPLPAVNGTHPACAAPTLCAGASTTASPTDTTGIQAGAGPQPAGGGTPPSAAPAGPPALPAAAPGSAQPLTNAWPPFNPSLCGSNCVLIAQVVDTYLDTGVFTPAPPSGTTGVDVPDSGPPDAGSDATWVGTNSSGDPLTPADIVNQLQQAANGNVDPATGNPLTDWYGDSARGIILVAKPSTTDPTKKDAHEFNVIDKNGTVSAIDLQGRVAGSISDVAAAGTFTGPGVTWSFKQTYPLNSGF